MRPLDPAGEVLPGGREAARRSGSTSMPRSRTNRSAAYEVGCTTDSGPSTCSSACVVGVHLHGRPPGRPSSAARCRSAGQQQVRLLPVEPPAAEHRPRLDQQHRLVGRVEEVRAELVGEQPAGAHARHRVRAASCRPPLPVEGVQHRDELRGRRQRRGRAGQQHQPAVPPPPQVGRQRARLVPPELVGVDEQRLRGVEGRRRPRTGAQSTRCRVGRTTSAPAAGTSRRRSASRRGRRRTAPPTRAGRARRRPGRPGAGPAARRRAPARGPGRAARPRTPASRRRRRAGPGAAPRPAPRPGSPPAREPAAGGRRPRRAPPPRCTAGCAAGAAARPGPPGRPAAPASAPAPAAPASPGPARRRPARERSAPAGRAARPCPPPARAAGPARRQRLDRQAEPWRRPPGRRPRTPARGCARPAATGQLTCRSRPGPVLLAQLELLHLAGGGARDRVAAAPPTSAPCSRRAGTCSAR